MIQLWAKLGKDFAKLSLTDNCNNAVSQRPSHAQLTHLEQRKNFWFLWKLYTGALFSSHPWVS